MKIQQTTLKNAIFSIGMLGLLFFIPRLAKAQNKAEFKQPGYYHMALGDIEIIALSDGTAPQDLTKLLVDKDPSEIERLLKSNFQTNILECSVNAYLIKSSGKLILIDAGTSELYGPQLGHLKENLISAGYRPEQIDAVLLTHIHLDHIGGLTTGEQLTFPNADVYINKEEANFWLDSANKKIVEKNQLAWFDGAILKLTPVIKAGKLKKFDVGSELFPGITAINGAGHTPGHTFYVVESKGQKIVFTGDIVVSLPVQFAAPNITSIYDENPTKATASRNNLLKSAANDGYWLAVAHGSFPGIGHVAKEENGYKWIPINYSSNGIGQ